MIEQGNKLMICYKNRIVGLDKPKRGDVIHVGGIKIVIGALLYYYVENNYKQGIVWYIAGINDKGKYFYWQQAIDGGYLEVV
mgnify:CR=1 FL=1